MRPTPGDDGFSIIESVIALTIVFGLVLTLLRTFDAGTRVVVESGRRSAATALASELIERSRSLEWSHMGLTSDANGADCPDDVACATHPPSISGGVATNANGNYEFEGEEIVFANGPTFAPFLSFAEDITRGGVDYTRYLFVTSMRTDQLDPTTETGRRITSVVRWQAPNGHVDEIRLATIVSEFTEPSQPFIHGEIDLRGGTATIRGSDARCSGDPECGAYAGGTARFDGGSPERADLQVDLVFPSAFVSATSDYVSQGTARVRGSAADIRFAGADGLLNTVDDDLTLAGGTEALFISDDDASSLPTTYDAVTITTTLSPTLDHSGVFPLDAVVAALERTAQIDYTAAAQTDTADYLASTWTEHDIDPGPDVDDGLPFADTYFDSAETIQAGFIEYESAAFRAVYEPLLGTSLDSSAYLFTLLRHGDTATNEAWELDGVVNRTNTVGGDRLVEVTANWEPEEILLGADTVQNQLPGRNDFEGWVRITLPDLDIISPMQAGETASFPPTLTAGTLVIEFWNGATGNYVTAFNSYGSLNCGDIATVSFTNEPAIGGPQVLVITPSDEPNLRYEVDATFTVRGACEDHTFDTLGAVDSANIQTSSFLTGTLTYKVTDVILEGAFGDGTLFDLELDLDAGGLDATALFFNPDAP